MAKPYKKIAKIEEQKYMYAARNYKNLGTIFKPTGK